MSDRTVFYSWQSDTDKRTNRNFIERALERGCRGAGQQLHIDLRIDQDSRGEAGSPVIPETMRRKIEGAAVFVADLTIVETRGSGIGGLINSNVGIEWGWASAALGDSGLIGVINEAYGDPGQLPVDIRQQLVRVRYRLCVSRAHESLPFALQHLYRNEATRAFAEGRASLRPIVPKASQQLG